MQFTTVDRDSRALDMIERVVVGGYSIVQVAKHYRLSYGYTCDEIARIKEEMGYYTTVIRLRNSREQVIASINKKRALLRIVPQNSLFASAGK